MKTSLFALFSLATSLAAHAGAENFPLKNHSVFKGSEMSHNPFWPIGWSKSTQAVSAIPEATLTVADFTVTSILINEPPLAVINGKAMAEGEMLAVTFQNQKVLVQLAAVQDGQVLLRYRDKSLIVPLTRRGEMKPIGGPTALR